MRVELSRFNRWILCGYILPEIAIKPGQVWEGSSGNTVTVDSVEDGWVRYTWVEKGKDVLHEKDSFSFQCRYCLVLPGPHFSEEFV